MKYDRLDFVDNAKYKGDYRDGMKHGIGVFTWADGREYEGSYVNDKKEGGGRCRTFKISVYKYKYFY